MFKCFRQLEHSDCGLTCIRMIARFYGAKIPIQYLRKFADLNRLGMSIKDINSIFARIGIDSYAVRVGMEHVVKMPLPAILYWQQKHFVVLYKVGSKGNKYFIADPSEGKITYSREDFSSCWIPQDHNLGLAILSEPNENFVKNRYPKTNVFKNFFRFILDFITPHKYNFIWALLITIILMAADFAIPLVLQKTVDDGILNKDLGLVYILLLSQLAITIGSLASSYGMNWILTKTGLRINLRMVNSFLNKLAGFPISFFDRKVSSDFVQKINDLSRIKDFLVSFPNEMLVMSLTLLVFSVLLFYYNPLIFVIVLLLSAIEIIWNVLFIKKRKSLDMALFHHTSENRNHAYELTNGMADLKINNAEKARIGKWSKTQNEINKVSLKTSLISIVQGGGHSIISRIKELSVSGISAFLVVNGDMSIGVMITLGYLAGRLAQPFAQLSLSIQSWQYAMLSYERIEDVINNDSEVRGNIKYSSPTISLSNVWFKYAGSSSPFVIKNCSLDILPGEVIAIVGESGCGKSTLIKLMLGFYIPQRGKLELSGNDIANIDHSDWLRHCGVVMQEAKIFTGSILDNITLSSVSMSKEIKEEVEKLLQAVGLYDFVRTLPMGIYTNLGVAGIELSGGQKQRLMIARAMFKKPDILFLDEATSSLDANNERTIVEKIREFGTGKTIIIAAHRLSTVMDADKIIYIKDGCITEVGTHTELVSQKGNYWHLVKNQLQLSLDS